MIQDTNAMYEILITTFQESTQAWYYSLKSSSISSFYDLNSKLITRFSISIYAKKNLTKLFSITQLERENTYLKKKLIKRC